MLSLQIDNSAIPWWQILKIVLCSVIYRNLLFRFFSNLLFYSSLINYVSVNVYFVFIGALIVLGKSHKFRFNHPAEAAVLRLRRSVSSKTGFLTYFFSSFCPFFFFLKAGLIKIIFHLIIIFTCLISFI